MDAQWIVFRELPPTYFASLELRGSYRGVGRGLVELERMMKEAGVRPSGRPFVLLYDNPTETAEAELRSEACFPVERPFEAAGAMKSKEHPAGTVAETRHEGPAEEYTKTYGAFLEGLPKMGYSLDGPTREFFDEASESLGPGMGSLIQQPVSKRP